jgi:hypothetical protein
MLRTATTLIGESTRVEDAPDCQELSAAIAQFKVLHRRRYEQIFAGHEQVVGLVRRIATKLTVLSALRDRLAVLEGEVAAVEEEISSLVKQHMVTIERARELLAGTGWDRKSLG